MEFEFIKRLFGVLLIIVGVFVALYGGCWVMIGYDGGVVDWGNILQLVFGVACIYLGIRMVQTESEEW